MIFRNLKSSKNISMLRLTSLSNFDMGPNETYFFTKCNLSIKKLGLKIRNYSFSGPLLSHLKTEDSRVFENRFISANQYVNYKLNIYLIDFSLLYHVCKNFEIASDSRTQQRKPGLNSFPL